MSVQGYLGARITDPERPAFARRYGYSYTREPATYEEFSRLVCGRVIKFATWHDGNLRQVDAFLDHYGELRLAASAFKKDLDERLPGARARLRAAGMFAARGDWEGA